MVKGLTLECLSSKNFKIVSENLILTTKYERVYTALCKVVMEKYRGIVIT